MRSAISKTGSPNKMAAYLPFVRSLVLPASLNSWLDGTSSDWSVVPDPTGLNSGSQYVAPYYNAWTEIANKTYAKYANPTFGSFVFAQNTSKKMVMNGGWFEKLVSIRGFAPYHVLKAGANPSLGSRYVFKVIELDSTTGIALLHDGGSNLYLRAFTIAATGALTFGSEATITTGLSLYGGADGLGLTLIGSMKVVVAYRKSSGNFGEATVCTISGTTITVGTPAGFDTGAAFNNGTRVAKLNTDKFIVAWSPSAARTKFIAATVSGTTITFGSAVQCSTCPTAAHTDIIQNGTDKAFAYIMHSTTPYVVSMTVSGTTITLGTEVAVAPLVGLTFGATYDSTTSRKGQMFLCAADKVLFVGTETVSPTTYLTACIFTMSGNVVTQQTSTGAFAPTVLGVYDGVMSNGVTSYSCIIQNLLEETAGSSYLLFGNASGAATYASCNRISVSSNTVTIGMTRRAAQFTFGNSETCKGQYCKIGSYIVNLADQQTTAVLYSTALWSVSLEFYNKTTQIGSTHTPIGLVEDLFVCDSAVQGKNAYLQMKMTSATTATVTLNEVGVQVE